MVFSLATSVAVCKLASIQDHIYLAQSETIDLPMGIVTNATQ